MTTPKAIEPALVNATATVATVPAATPGPQPVALPWAQDLAAPSSAASRAVSPRPALHRGPRTPAFEAVHWSVTVLTVVTALGILVGSYGGQPSQPRELLPIVMTVHP